MVTIGSLSKTHWGGLRVGWIRATAKMITELTTVRVAADMTGSVLDQLVALPLLEGLDRSLPERLAELRVRRGALVRALQRHTPEWSWQLPPGGLSLWVDLGEPVSSALSERAAAAACAHWAWCPLRGRPGHLRAPAADPVHAARGPPGRGRPASRDRLPRGRPADPGGAAAALGGVGAAGAYRLRIRRRPAAAATAAVRESTPSFA